MKYYIVDAFTRQVFSGNPAAVCVPDTWPDDDLMQRIAFENNLSETAFAVPSAQSDADYQIRWFTPSCEAPLCGHATLAASHIICRFVQPEFSAIRFHAPHSNHQLTVHRQGDAYALHFPSLPPQPFAATQQMIDALGTVPLETHLASHLIFLLQSDEQVAALTPDFAAMLQIPEGRGCVVTAPGHDCDFVSRAFIPKAGINEDPVNGSSHCSLIPFWARRLGKTTLLAQQRSRRGGTLYCQHLGDTVSFAGHAALYAQGEIFV